MKLKLSITLPDIYFTRNIHSSIEIISMINQWLQKKKYLKNNSLSIVWNNLVKKLESNKIIFQVFHKRVIYIYYLYMLIYIFSMINQWLQKKKYLKNNFLSIVWNNLVKKLESNKIIFQVFYKRVIYIYYLYMLIYIFSMINQWLQKKKIFKK